MHRNVAGSARSRSDLKSPHEMAAEQRRFLFAACGIAVRRRRRIGRLAVAADIRTQRQSQPGFIDGQRKYEVCRDSRTIALLHSK
jgi:hypothetical protein